MLAFSVPDLRSGHRRRHDDNRMSKDNFLSLAFSRQVLPRAIRVSLFVGTVLALINHGDKLLAMSLSVQDIVKIFLTYLVPYGVSTWSAVGALRENASGGT